MFSSPNLGDTPTTFKCGRRSRDHPDPIDFRYRTIYRIYGITDRFRPMTPSTIKIQPIFSNDDSIRMSISPSVLDKSGMRFIHRNSKVIKILLREIREKLTCLYRSGHGTHIKHNPITIKQ